MERPAMVRPLSIGQLAAAAGVQISTIRFYERSGLLPCASRTAGGHRHYSADDVHRVQFIRRARELAFSLDDVRIMLGGTPGEAGECERARRLAEEHLARIRDQIAQLQKKETVLSALVGRCEDGYRGPCPLRSEFRNHTPLLSGSSPFRSRRTAPAV
jgi:MerR family transcriptional regulator, mercuric resistance operon regulatory protein